MFGTAVAVPMTRMYMCFEIATVMVVVAIVWLRADVGGIAPKTVSKRVQRTVPKTVLPMVPKTVRGDGAGDGAEDGAEDGGAEGPTELFS